ncbi:MAG: type II toxin-antitoxin system RelE/ParE family toxin [Nitrospirae bacterium]|nr:type II toxin-antitoxin system RelE/ParE family toxin [Candidatus Troglogloeales bacterium]
MYRITTTPEFDKDIKALDKPATVRIINKIEWLSLNPQAIKYPLKHMPADLKGLQKYRVGDYRILFWVDHHHKTLTLYGVEHRRTVYKKL